MIAALAILSVLSLALVALVAYRFRTADRNFDSLLSATQSLLQDTQREREAQAKQVSELLNRIQAPDVAPYVETGEFGKQHVSFDNDEDFWQTQDKD